MKTRTLLTGLAASTLAASACADVVGITSMTSTGTAATLNGDASVLIDGNGLSAALATDESNLATVTHGDAGAADRWVTTAPGGGVSDWFASNGGTTVIFDIVLDGTHTLDQFVNWGYGFASTNGNSMSDVTLDFYTNGTGAGAADSSQNITADLVFGTASIQSLTPVSANFVRLTVNDNHFPGEAPSFGGDRVGLVEIAFTNNVPEPGSLALLGLGGLALLRRRRA